MVLWLDLKSEGGKTTSVIFAHLTRYPLATDHIVELFLTLMQSLRKVDTRLCTIDYKPRTMNKERGRRSKLLGSGSK